MDSAIIAKFGGDTTDLRRATTEAEIMVKGFGTAAGRAVGEIGAGFGAAVAIMETVKAMKELGGAAIDAAKAERDLSTNGVVSDQAQAWLDLANNSSTLWSQIKLGATGAMEQFLGYGESVKSWIMSLAGVGQQEQNLFDRIGNSAEANIDRMQAARDKFLADLPAKQASANAKLEALDAQYADSQAEGKDKVIELTQKQNDILAQIVATNQVIDTQEAAGRDTAAARYQLSLEEVALMQATVDLQKAQVQAAQDEVKANTEAFNTNKSTMTIEEQIVALTKQQTQYQQEAAAATTNEAQQKVLTNAAAKLGVQIAQDNETIRKATALSEADQLSIFISENSQLSGLNTLSSNQLSLLQQQEKENQNIYAQKQLLAKGVENLTAAEKDELTALVQQGQQLKQNLDLINQAIAAENTPVAPKGGSILTLPNGRSIDLGGDAPNITTQILDKNGNPTGMWNTEAGSGSGGGFSGPGFMGNNTFNPGLTGVGYGNQQLQDQYTANNNQSFVNSQISALQTRINALENSDIKSNEDLVPTLQKQLQVLQQIHNGVVPALSGSQ